MIVLAHQVFPEWLFAVLGWIPALVFPMASGLQLLAILRRKCSQGVSIPAWALFAVANACLFAYTEKYSEAESILGTLGTATLNVCIVIAAMRYRGPSRRNGGGSAPVNAVASSEVESTPPSPQSA